jgi:hypothetical protein
VRARGDDKRVIKVDRIVNKGVYAGQDQMASRSQKSGSEVRRGSGSVRRIRSVTGKHSRVEAGKSS